MIGSSPKDEESGTLVDEEEDGFSGEVDSFQFESSSEAYEGESRVEAGGKGLGTKPPTGGGRAERNAYITQSNNTLWHEARRGTLPPRLLIASKAKYFKCGITRPLDTRATAKKKQRQKQKHAGECHPARYSLLAPHKDQNTKKAHQRNGRCWLFGFGIQKLINKPHTLSASNEARWTRNLLS